MTADIEEQLKAQLPPENDIGRYDGFGYFENDAAGAETGICIGDRKKTEELPDTITEQAAVNYVKEAYADLGIDMDELQFRYLFSTGAKNDRSCISRNGGKRSCRISCIPRRSGGRTRSKRKSV